jgi:hypothetical protein
MMTEYQAERSAFWVNGTGEGVNYTQGLGKRLPARQTLDVALRSNTVGKLSGVVCQKLAARTRQVAHDFNIELFRSDSPLRST